MRHVTYERVHNLRKSTHMQEEEGSIMNEYNAFFDNRKAKTCNEIGMLPSVWNVTEIFCFPFRSRNVNVCRVFDSWACNIYLPMWEAGITVLSCCSQNISQKGRNRLRRSKKVYKHRGFRHRHTRDSQGWQHCVVVPLAKHLAGTTGRVEKVKACVVRRQVMEEGRTKVR